MLEPPSRRSALPQYAKAGPPVLRPSKLAARPVSTRLSAWRSSALPRYSTRSR
jgi:hypothetical protein